MPCGRARSATSKYDGAASAWYLPLSRGVDAPFRPTGYAASSMVLIQDLMLVDRREANLMRSLEAQGREDCIDLRRCQYSACAQERLEHRHNLPACLECIRRFPVGNRTNSPRNRR